MFQQDFTQTYMNHKEDVWKLVSKYVSQQQDREDLFQEVFLAIHKALPRFRGEASIRTWIYRVTVNTSINYLKKQHRYKALKSVLGAMRIIAVEERDAMSDVSLLNPLEKLNPQQKMILIMSDVQDIDLQEISKLLNLPLGTVKSNLFRGREIVKKELMNNDQL